MSAGEAEGVKAPSIFTRPLPLVRGVHIASEAQSSEDEVHTSGAFSEKWLSLQQTRPDKEEGWKTENFRWYLSCYGYESEAALAEAVLGRSMILDAGCGPGYKAAWLARMNPNATVVAMDLSDSVFVAAERYANLPNMVFVKGDIAQTPFPDRLFDFISCDQVLHHTEDPPATLREFARILTPGGQLNTYVYAKKALPRELLDEHMRQYSKQLTSKQLWDLSAQLTELGKTLSELKLTINVPDIPAFGIKGGQQDLQRFVYWNFIKCFWNQVHGQQASTLINFDWYSPSIAFRYSREDFIDMLARAGFKPDYLHSEEACHTGRFTK